MQQTPAILPTPSTPAQAIHSRRTHCYNFSAVIDIQKKPGLTAHLRTTRNAILEIAGHTRKSPLSIKNSFFHAAVFGMQPLLDKQEFQKQYMGEQGLLKQSTLDDMCHTLQEHLKTKKPQLIFNKCEMMPDGTVLARYDYKTADEDKTPLLNLTRKLDPKETFKKWGNDNPIRYTTVTIVMCVVDITQSSEKESVIDTELAKLTENLKALNNGTLDVNDFILFESSEKRTHSVRKTKTYAEISAHEIKRA